METNTSEPLIKCRKRRDVIKTRGESLTWDELGRYLPTDPGGDRHGGGVNLAQAPARNVGTFLCDGKGAAQVADPQEPEYRCAEKGRTDQYERRGACNGRGAKRSGHPVMSVGQPATGGTSGQNKAV